MLLDVEAGGVGGAAGAPDAGSLHGHSSDSTTVGGGAAVSTDEKKDPCTDGCAEAHNTTDAGAGTVATVAPATATGTVLMNRDGQPVVWDWDTDAANPYNWTMGRKWTQVAVFSVVAFSTSLGTSILSPAHAALMADFGAGSTRAIVPLTCYVLALGIGPVFIGGPLSEVVGRYPVLLLGTPFGLLFSVGAALVPASSLAGLCILRFLSGFAVSPSLAVAAGVLSETFRPVERGLPVGVFIMTPFLGPGMGPVLGAFATRKGWRWTEWTLVFFFAFSFALSLAGGRETYHPVLKQRRARQLGVTLPASEQPPAEPWGQRARTFLTAGLVRPLRMMATDPIVGLSCLYVACEFATLFSFFAAVPYVFAVTYGFGREQSGLVFLAIVVGCVLGLVTVALCDALLYRGRQVPRHHPAPPPPEHRLYAAMVGSVGLPVGLFWFGWSAHGHAAPWISPALAIVPFAWGNICIFISLFQFIGDAYAPRVVASAASANSLARYVLAGVFPLFTLQMYERLGIAWASSLLAFLALALLPVPWLFFRFGPVLRASSKYI